MLNICARNIWKSQPLKHIYRIFALQNYATFSVKDVLYETSDEAGTLLTRFAKHVALERQKICDQVPNKVKYSDYFPISDMRYFQKELQKTDENQIAAVVIFAFTYRSNADPGKFAIILNELDKYATNNIEKMNADTILRTLYAFLYLVPNWMTRLDFYGRAMQRLHDDFSKQDLKPKEQFVQMCFYMGLNKKQTKFNVINLLNSLLDGNLGQYFNEMSILDLALVSNAAYKTSIVIKNEDFNQRLLREVLNMSNTLNGNDALLVTLIKSMRLQRLRSLEVCKYIENICQDSVKLQQLQTRGHIHLFAYLAENLWDCIQGTHSLIEMFTEQLTLSRNKNASRSQAIRGKDISTFLWSCAQLNCKLSSIQFRTIENSLLEKLDSGEFKYFPDQLVDSCLSLWILGYKTKELFQAAVKLKSESNSKYKQPKVESRLNVLLSAVQIEEPVWCSHVIKNFEAFNLAAKVPSYLLNHDIPYQKIIDELLKDETVSSAKLSCPINGINIPGIHVKLSSSTESQVFLEFLTPTQTLHFSREPVAILRLKIRLLQSLGHNVKVLSSTDVLNSQYLKEALQNDSEVQGELVKEPSESSIKA